MTDEMTRAFDIAMFKNLIKDYPFHFEVRKSSIDVFEILEPEFGKGERWFCPFGNGETRACTDDEQHPVDVARDTRGQLRFGLIFFKSENDAVKARLMIDG